MPGISPESFPAAEVKALSAYSDLNHPDIPNQTGPAVIMKNHPVIIALKPPTNTDSARGKSFPKSQDL